MPYIWEEYSSNKRYRVGKRICPYLEVFESKQTNIEVNPMIRFSEVIDMDVIRYDNSGDVQNIIFHYLAQLDQVKGLSYYQSVIENIRNEIIEGYWGKKISGIWDELIDEHQKIIISTLAQRLLNNNKTFFMDAIGKLFLEASLCYEEKTDLYYLYIRANANHYNSRLLDAVINLFWNINKNILIIWKNHYGIIGTDGTMQIGRMQIV